MLRKDTNLHWEDDDEWYPGEVSATRDGEIDVIYDDGETDEGISLAIVRPAADVDDDGDYYEEDEDEDEGEGEGVFDPRGNEAEVVR